jgi:TniQ
MPRRRLPVQIEPMAGEAVNSWLEATAAHMDTPVGSLARLAGLSIARRPAWGRWMGPDESRALEVATGVRAGAIQSMTLQSYDNRALWLDPDSHRLDPAFPYGALRRSRFCPRCLQETGGRWRLSWRLGWSLRVPSTGVFLSMSVPPAGNIKDANKITQASRCQRDARAVTTCARSEVRRSAMRMRSYTPAAGVIDQRQ